MILDWSDLKKILEKRASLEETARFEEWLSQNSHNKKYFEKIKFFYDDPKLAVEENQKQRKQKHSADYILKRYKLRKRTKFVFAAVSSIAAAVIAVNFLVVQTHKKEESVIEKANLQHRILSIKKTEKSVKIIKDNGEEFLPNQIASSGSNVEVNDKKAEVVYFSKKIATDESEQDKKPVEYHTISIPSKQDYNLTLSDGTKVRINSGSQLRYPTEFVKGKERKVYLSGEAYFEVSHNDTDKFIVGVDNMEVKVYGTKFNINSFEKDIETVLVEGSVAIKVGDGEFKLTPNQRAKVSKLSETVRIDSVDISQYVSWIDGYLCFKDTPMKEIAKKLSRYYDAQIILDNDVVGQQLISGYIDKSSSLDDILKAISGTGKIKYHQNNGQYLIR